MGTTKRIQESGGNGGRRMRERKKIHNRNVEIDRLEGNLSWPQHSLVAALGVTEASRDKNNFIQLLTGGNQYKKHDCIKNPDLERVKGETKVLR